MVKDLEMLYAEVRRDLDAIAIPYRPVDRLTIHTRWTRRWGECRIRNGEVEAIGISARLLQDDVPDQAVKNVIAHELLHTVRGCYAHRGKWQQLADMVNRALPSYRITCTAKAEEYGLAPPEQKPPCYVLLCTACGMRYDRQRRSKAVQNPGRYRCGRCGGPLVARHTGDVK